MNKLLIIWSTSEIEVAKKMILLYGSVMLFVTIGIIYELDVNFYF